MPAGFPTLVQQEAHNRRSGWLWVNPSDAMTLCCKTEHVHARTMRTLEETSSIHCFAAATLCRVYDPSTVHVHAARLTLSATLGCLINCIGMPSKHIHEQVCRRVMTLPLVTG